MIVLQQIQACRCCETAAILPITYIRGDSAVNVVSQRVEFGGAAHARIAAIED